MAQPIYNTQSITSLVGYVDFAINQIETGEITLIEKYSGGDPVPATIDSKNVNNQESLNKLKGFLKTLENKTVSIPDYKSTLKQIPLIVNEDLNFSPTAGNIMKNGEKVPFGYLAEILLQAAIVARFVDKRDESSNVNLSDVLKFLEQYVKSKSESSAERAILDKLPKSKAVNKAFEYDVPNKNTKIGKDKVYVYYSLNDSAFRWLNKKLQTVKTNRELMPFFEDAIRYVNSGAAKQHSHYFYTNNKVDRIDIVSLGIMGQNQTKADVRTMYYEGWEGGNSGKRTDMTLNLSVKIRHVEQVGQISGITTKTYGPLTEYFGVPLSKNDASKIDSIGGMLQETKKLDKNLQGQVYDIVYKRLSEATNIDKLLNGMEYFIALTSQEARTLTVVDIGAGLKTYYVKNLKEMKKRLHNRSVKSQIKTGGGQGTTKSITYTIDGEALFSISSRYTGGVYRNFVSTGPLLRTYLAGNL